MQVLPFFLGNIEVLQSLEAFCLTYEHMDSCYILLKQQFSAKIVANKYRCAQGSLLQRTKQRVYRKPSSAKKRLRKISMKHSMDSFQKMAQKNQENPMGQFWYRKAEEVEKTNFEQDLTKVLEFCLDDHGISTGTAVTVEL